MQPRVDIITLGVPDLDVARRFYLDGLGWPAVFDVPGEVVFIQIGHGLLLGLFGSAALDVDAGDAPERGPTPSPRPCRWPTSCQPRTRWANCYARPRRPAAPS